MSESVPGTVALVTLGCARNEVDSEEMAARLAAGGWTLVDDPEAADAVIVNTCGFVDVAKKDSIDTILAAADLKTDGAGPAVVAVGCLAERYGAELEQTLPEADAVLGFDEYDDISRTLRDIVRGERHPAHEPRDRRLLLPVSPVARREATHSIPGHAQARPESPGDAPGWQPPVLRRRLDDSPVAPVKLASGCDRRCAFCAIPSFRGSFVSRPVDEVVGEIAWLREQGVREVVLVSENSTSYGKDLGNLRLLEESLAPMVASTGIERLRIAYLQPAEVRPGLLEAIARTPGVADYFDLSFQHASSTLLRRMRRFGGVEEFLALVSSIRALAPEAGIRSNVIVGFPGETEEEFADLLRFLAEARLDAVGVFAYSDEEGTEAAELSGKVDEDVIRARFAQASELVDELMVQRAEDRIGTEAVVLVERFEDDGVELVRVGRAGHQGPDDAETFIAGCDASVGDFVRVRIVDTDGVDLIAEACE